MKKLAILLALIMVLAFITPAMSLTKKELKAMKAKLEQLSAIEKAKPEVKINGVKVAVDKDNRVFVSDKASVEVNIAHLKYTGEIELKADVAVAPKLEVKPFSSRFGLVYGVTPKNEKEDKLDRGKLALTFAPLQYKKFSVEGVANLQFWGLGAGWRLTKNSKIVGAAIVDYGKKINAENIKPFVGFGFNF